jgi:hypothetical protein
MKKSPILAALILGLAGAIASVPAFADSMLYDNSTAGSYGVVNPTGEPFGILNVGPVAYTESFVLSQSSTVTEATASIWVSSGASITAGDWAITTQEFGGTTDTSGSLVGLTTALLYSDVPWGAPQGPTADILDVEIPISPSLQLDAGTYWFELEDVGQTGGTAYWDVSEGPSTACRSDNDSCSVYYSSTFQILGTQDAATPEPSSFLLLASGLAGLAGMVRRKLRG